MHKVGVIQFLLIPLVHLALLIPGVSFGAEDPTGGKPFLPWLWSDQLKPTIANSLEKDGLWIVGGTLATTALSHQFDDDIYDHSRNGGEPLMDGEISGLLGTLGGGGLGIGITVAQLFLDQPNGLKHGRAIFLTTVSHASLAFAVQRERPGGRGDFLPFPSSFPSGHSSSNFATASALAYAYGWKVGVPAYMVATSIAAARVSENAHYLSDVVAGAGLGIFWAAASYRVDESRESLSWFPTTLPGGAGVTIVQTF